MFILDGVADRRHLAPAGYMSFFGQHAVDTNVREQYSRLLSMQRSLIADVPANRTLMGIGQDIG